jgi:uncharacterized protein
MPTRPIVRLVAEVAAVLLVGSVVGLVATACGDDGSGSLGGSADRDAGAAKVTVAGDSISYGLGTELREVVPDGVEVKVIGEGGTGLARPDKFDWPARLETLAREFPPTTLLFAVGSNDHQDLADSEGTVVVPLADEQQWDAEYSARLGRVFDAFEGTGTRVVFAGQVRTKDRGVAETNRHVLALARDVATDRPWVEVVDLSKLLGIGDATATSCLIGDGLHLSPECYRRADEAMLPELGVGG